jgi:hypothetical protein
MAASTKGWRTVNHRGSSRHLATGRYCAMAAPRCGMIVPSTNRCGSATGSVAKRTCRPRLTRCVDGPASPSARQRRPHGDAPAQTRALTKHQAAQINYAQNTTGAVGDKAWRKAGTLLVPKGGRRQRRKQLKKGLEEGDEEDQASCSWLALI